MKSVASRQPAAKQPASLAHQPTQGEGQSEFSPDVWSSALAALAQNADPTRVGAVIQTKPAAPLIQTAHRPHYLTQQPNRTGLPDALKTGIESRSGVSLDDVRVHPNSDQPARLNALAYTQGSEIHVAPGQDAYLPHEAWHVVQQKQGRVQPTLQIGGAAINDDPALEHEASQMGANAARTTATRLRSPASGSAARPGTPVIQRVTVEELESELKLRVNAGGFSSLQETVEFLKGSFGETLAGLSIEELRETLDAWGYEVGVPVYEASKPVNLNSPPQPKKKSTVAKEPVVLPEKPPEAVTETTQKPEKKGKNKPIKMSFGEFKEGLKNVPLAPKNFGGVAIPALKTATSKDFQAPVNESDIDMQKVEKVITAFNEWKSGQPKGHGGIKVNGLTESEKQAIISKVPNSYIINDGPGTNEYEGTIQLKISHPSIKVLGATSSGEKNVTFHITYDKS
jgi:Domain of unknown function (DUF4157)